MPEETIIIRLTKAAVTRMEELQKGRAQPVKLRVYIEGGGCSGFQYKFKLEETVFEEDLVIPAFVISEEQEILPTSIEVILDSISLPYVQHATIDYVKNLTGARFQISDNPNAHVTCGCGASFSPNLKE